MPTYKTYSSEKWKDPNWIRNARLKLKEAGVPDAVAAFEADLTDFQEQYMSPIEIRQFEANLKALGLKEVAGKAPPEAIEKAKVEVEKIGEEKAKPKPVSAFELPYSTAEMRERLVTPPVKEAIPEEKQLLEQAVRKEAELPPIREVEKKYPKEVIRELYDLAKGKVIEPSEEETLTHKIRQGMPVFAPVMEPGLSPEEMEARENALQAKWDAEYQRRLAEANLPTTMLEPLERRLKELGVTPEDYAAIRTPIAQREHVGEMVGPAIQIAAVVALVSLMGYQGIRGVVGQIQYNKALKAMENIDKAYKNLAAGKATAADNALLARWEEAAKNPAFQLTPAQLAKLSGGPTEAEYQAKLTQLLEKKIVPRNVLEEGLERSRQYALKPPTTQLPTGVKGRLGNLDILKDVSKYNLMAARSNMPLIKDIRTLQDAAKVSTFAPPPTPEVTEYVGKLKTIELAKDMITNWPALTGQAAEAVQIPITVAQAGPEVITVFNSALIVNALSGAPLGQAMQAAMEVVKQVQVLPVTPPVTPARAAWKPAPPVHPRDFEEDLPKKELILQIARSPTQSVPYAEVEKQVGTQGFAQMVGTGVLERRGEDVILGANGKRLVTKLQSQEKRLEKFQKATEKMYPEPAEPSAIRTGLGDRSRTATEIQRYFEEEGTTLADYGDQEIKEWLGLHLSSPFDVSHLVGKVKGKRPIPIYRATDRETEITAGSYVTPSKAYAQAHIENNMPQGGRIIEGTAYPDELIPVNPDEFWYAPRSLRQTPPAEAEPSAVSREPKVETYPEIEDRWNRLKQQAGYHSTLGKWLMPDIGDVIEYPEGSGTITGVQSVLGEKTFAIRTSYGHETIPQSQAKLFSRWGVDISDLTRIWQEAHQEKVEAPGVVEPVLPEEGVKPETPPPVGLVEPTAPSRPPTAKEPWQMTREEFKNRLYAYGLTEDVRDLIYQSRAFRPGWYVAGKFIWGNPTQDHRELYDPTREELMSGKAIPVVEISSVVNRFIDQDKVSPGVYFIVQPQDHKLIIQQALAEGKPVPPEVLAEYPDLAGPEEPTAPSRPPTAKEPWQMTREEMEIEATTAWIERKEELMQSYQKRQGKLPSPRTEKRLAIQAQREVNQQILGRDFYHKPDRFGAHFPSADQIHRIIVEDALAEGKPVPLEVLAEYPDLAAVAEPTAPSRPPTAEVTDLWKQNLADEMNSVPTSELLAVAHKLALQHPTLESWMQPHIGDFVEHPGGSGWIRGVKKYKGEERYLIQSVERTEYLPSKERVKLLARSGISVEELPEVWQEAQQVPPAVEGPAVVGMGLEGVEIQGVKGHQWIVVDEQKVLADMAGNPIRWPRGRERIGQRYLEALQHKYPEIGANLQLQWTGVTPEEYLYIVPAGVTPPAVEEPIAEGAIEIPSGYANVFNMVKESMARQGNSFPSDEEVHRATVKEILDGYRDLEDARDDLIEMRRNPDFVRSTPLGAEVNARTLEEAIRRTEAVAEPAVIAEPTAPVVEEPDIPTKIEAWAAQADKAALKTFRATVDELYDAGQSYAEAEAMAYRQMTGEAEPTVVKPEQVPEVVNNLNATNREKFEAVESEMMDAGVASEDAEALALEQVAGVKVDDPRKANRIENGFYKVPEEFERIVPRRGEVDPRNRRIARYIAEDGTRLTQFRNGDWGVSGPMMTPFQRFAEPGAYDQVMAEVERRRTRFLAIGKLKQLAEGRVVVDAVGKEYKLGMNKARRWIKQMTGKEVWADVTAGDIEDALQYLPFIGPRFKTRPFADLWYEASDMVKTGELNPDVTAFANNHDIVVETSDEFGQPREPTPAEVGQAVMDFLRDQSLDPYPGPPAGRELISPELLKRLEGAQLVGWEKLFVPAMKEFEKMGIGEMFFEAEKANAEYMHPLNEALARFKHLKKDLRSEVGRKPANAFIRKEQAFNILDGTATVQGLEAPYVKFIDGMRKLIDDVQERVDRARTIQGLPPLEKREHYIRHMFDQYVSDMLREKYPFDETVAFLIDTNRIPPSKIFDPTQLRRIGREGGLVKNLDRVVPGMFSIKLRYAGFQPFLTKWRPLIEKLPGPNRAFVNRWLEYNILNRPTEPMRAGKITTTQGEIGKAVQGFANLVAKFGEGGRETAARMRRDFPRWATGELTKLVYAGGMGLNIQTAMINVLQGVHNLAVNGPAGYARGSVALFDEWAWKISLDLNPTLQGRMPAEIFRTEAFRFSDVLGRVFKAGMLPYRLADLKNVHCCASGALHQLIPRYPGVMGRIKIAQGAGESFYQAVYKDMKANPGDYEEIWNRVIHKVGVAQYLYRSYSQSTIGQYPLGRILMIYKTWFQNWWTNYMPELWKMLRTGKDSMGFKVSPGERGSLLYYLAAMGLIITGARKLGINVSKIFMPWGRQASPFWALPVNFFDAIITSIKSIFDPNQRPGPKWKETWRSMQIFIAFWVGSRRIAQVATGAEPRWWSILARPAEPPPKPERIKAYERMTPQEQGNFVYTLSSEENQDLQRLIGEMKLAKKEDRDMKWTPAERRKAVKLCLKFNKYVDSLEKLKQKDEREAGRTLAEGDEAGARSILWAIGYRDENLEDKLAELERRWVPQTLWKINRFIGEAIEGLMPEAGPPAISGQPSAVSRQPSAGDGDWLYQNCTSKQLKDEGWVEEQRRKILETHGEEGIEEFDRDLVAAREML